MISTLQQQPVSDAARRQISPISTRAQFRRGAGAGRCRQNHASLQLPEILVPLDQDDWDMSRLAGGDDRALDSLIRRHAKRLFRHLTRMAGNHAEAADLVLESFVRVFRHRASFNYESRFSTWLYTIASNLAVDFLRRRARRPQHLPLPEAGDESIGDASQALVDPFPTPGERLEVEELTSAVDEALARLPDSLRLPLMLVAYEGCSQAEVAARLDCSIKTVEMRLYHGRKRLRSELQRILSPWRFGSRNSFGPSKPGIEH